VIGGIESGQFREFVRDQTRPREFVPPMAADALVDRVRHHYQRHTASAA
jgi:hypothetical protein